MATCVVCGKALTARQRLACSWACRRKLATQRAKEAYQRRTPEERQSLAAKRAEEHRRRRGNRVPHAAKLQWWQERMGDLRAMAVGEFARVHGVSRSAVAKRKAQLGVPTVLPKKRRWDQPEVRAILENEQLSPGEMAQMLGMSDSGFRDLRKQARLHGIVVRTRRDPPAPSAELLQIALARGGRPCLECGMPIGEDAHERRKFCCLGCRTRHQSRRAHAKRRSRRADD